MGVEWGGGGGVTSPCHDAEDKHNFADEHKIRYKPILYMQNGNKKGPTHGDLLCTLYKWKETKHN